MKCSAKTVAVTILLLVSYSLFAAGGPEGADEESLPTLRFLGPSASFDPNERYEAQLIQEITGYTVEYEALPGEGTAEKISLVLASQEPYDIISHRFRHADDAREYAEAGAILALDDLIAEYGPNVPAAISEASLDLFRINGTTYMLPAAVPVDFARWFITLRQDWLDAVGVDVPRTTAEFADVLEAFAAEDPAGNGSSNVPFTFADPLGLHGLMGAFGISNFWNVEGRDLVPMAKSPGFREYLIFMRDLYERELIDLEFPANTNSTVKEKFLSGRAGGAPWNVYDSDELVLDLVANVPNAEAVKLDAIGGPTGESGIRQESGYAFVTFIPTVSANPEHAMRWINLKLDEELFKTSVIGLEGTHHSFDGQAYAPILPAFSDEMGNGWFYLTGIREQDYGNYWLQVRLRRVPEMYDGFNAVQDIVADNYQLDVTTLVNAVPEFSSSRSELEGLLRDFATRVIAGAEDVSGLDALIARWEAAGGIAAEEALNAWYDNQ